jgi:HprK-related kinase A
VIISGLSFQEVSAALAGPGLRVSLGPVNVRIQTRLQELARQIFVLYAKHELAEDDIAEIHVRVIARRFIRKPFSAAVECLLDGQSVLPAVPVAQALDLLERCIKLAFVTRINYLLLFRAASLERNGHVLLLPGQQRSGKTTLSVALIRHGYRLLSDEFGILDLRSGQFVPMPTALSLSHESIQVLRQFSPEADMGQATGDAGFGTAKYLRPPEESVRRAGETASARWTVFPAFSALGEAPDERFELEPLTEGTMFLMLATHSYDYEILGAEGFRAVSQLVRSCRGYSLAYSDLENAVIALNDLTDAD